MTSPVKGKKEEMLRTQTPSAQIYKAYNPVQVVADSPTSKIIKGIPNPTIEGRNHMESIKMSLQHTDSQNKMKNAIFLHKTCTGLKGVIQEMIEYDEDKGLLVCKYIEGSTLLQIVQEEEKQGEEVQKVSRFFAYGISLDITRNIQNLHQQNVSHGNVHPDNIIVCDVNVDGREGYKSVTMIDLGKGWIQNASPLEPNDLNRYWSANELIYCDADAHRGSRSYKSDIFAVGFVLWMMLEPNRALPWTQYVQKNNQCLTPPSQEMHEHLYKEKSKYMDLQSQSNPDLCKLLQGIAIEHGKEHSKLMDCFLSQMCKERGGDSDDMSHFFPLCVRFIPHSINEIKSFQNLDVWNRIETLAKGNVEEFEQNKECFAKFVSKKKDEIVDWEKKGHLKSYWEAFAKKEASKTSDEEAVKGVAKKEASKTSDEEAVKGVAKKEASKMSEEEAIQGVAKKEASKMSEEKAIQGLDGGTFLYTCIYLLYTYNYYNTHKLCIHRFRRIATKYIIQSSVSKIIPTKQYELRQNICSH